MSHQHPGADDATMVIGCGLLTLIVVFIVFPVTAFVFMTLWNFVAHDVFGAPAISYIRSLAAVWLMALIGSLFRGVAVTRR